MYSDLPCSVYTVNGQMRIKRTYTRSIHIDLENIDKVFYLNVLVFNIQFSYLWQGHASSRDRSLLGFGTAAPSLTVPGSV